MKLRNILFTIPLVLAGLMFGCSKMDSKYQDFIKDGPIVYAGKPDSLRIHPGNNRMKISWLKSPDPKVVKAIVYWNNRKDSAIVPIDRSSPGNMVEVFLNNLPEGTYVFEVFTFDDKGRSSVKTEVIGNTYGENYQRTLLIRPVNVASVIGQDTARIDWGAASYAEAIASEVKYNDLSGREHKLVINSESANTVLTDVNAGTTFTYRTKYLPSPLAIDTFYTAFKTVKIKGPPIEVAKTGWTITASSEDVAGNRLAKNLIDGNLTNLYVNRIATGVAYPHWVVVDMGKTINDIEGFYFYQRGTNPLKTVEILISSNGTDYESLGDFILPNTPTVNTSQPQLAKPVYADLSRVRSFRYFRMVFKNDHTSSSVNVNIHEAGVFIR